MTIPFNRSTFQRDMKSRVSMAHLALEYENIESSVVKVCAELSDLLSPLTYEEVIAVGNKADTYVTAEEREAAAAGLDYLRRAILHFALYEHVIYTIANITNDGITVTKTDDKTTIYKYQQDQLEEHLIADAWFWLNRLIDLMNRYPGIFTEWDGSERQQSISDLPVTIDDFRRYVGVSDQTFLLYAAWIVREVLRECVYSRLPEGTPLTDLHIMALCYETMARACRRLAYHCLPSPIRRDLNNEMGKNHAAQADTAIREHVAQQFADKAFGYWQTLDAEQQRQATADAPAYPTPRPANPAQKFVC